MKQSEKAMKVSSYMAGFFAIAAAMLLVVFLVMSVIGLIHPRKERITLHTDSITKIYDGMPLVGIAPTVSRGSLHEGHRIEIRSLPEHSQVGEYLHAPEFVILDTSNADVTDQYDIIHDFGTITIQARKIAVSSLGKSKVYDEEPLASDDVWLSGGTLVQGHTIVSEGGNSRILPGEERIQPTYKIVSESGADVTNQYAITEQFGSLKILPIEITITTESAKKFYDGESLSAQEWAHIGGKLLAGHTVDMHVTASLDDVGSVKNEGYARIIDASGKDVTSLYQFDYRFGTLEIAPISLSITTMSAKKVYDGTPLMCDEWKLTSGVLEEGAVLEVGECKIHDGIGIVDNAIRFLVTDQNGRDITYRYSFDYNYGTLSIQPRTITIRTGSAEKVYDGQALSCDTFNIISGSLCEGEYVKITCASIVDVGYSENYVLECTIYRMAADGSLTDVSACYRIIFDFGMLRITA